jgi:hypothetical protein
VSVESGRRVVFAAQSERANPSHGFVGLTADHCAAAARVRAACPAHRQQVTDAAQLGEADSIRPGAGGRDHASREFSGPAPAVAAVVSLQQAVSWLGVAEVRNIATAVMLRGEVFNAPGHEPESEDLWREAWLAGLWAKEIARERRKHVESAFLAALMHRTGAALALKILSRFEAAQRTVMDARTFADLVAEFEPAFGRLLMDNWRLARGRARRGERLAQLPRVARTATSRAP